MANKNKKEDHRLGCLAIVIIAIIVITIIIVQLIPLLTPAIIAICAIVYFIIYRVKDRPHVKANFELSNEEKASLKNSARKYNWALNKIEELNRIIIEENLRHTKSGRLELRAHRAKDVQGAMDNANQMIKDEKPVYEHLLELPKKRYENASKHFSRSWACFLSVILWLAVVATQSHKEMLKYHQYETAVAVGKVLSIFDRDDNGPATSSDGKQNDNTQTVEQQSNDQQDLSKPTITIWKAFAIMLGAYLVVFVIAIIVFYSKHKKPKKIDVASL